MPRGVPPNDQEGVGELQWDYTATQQAFSKIDSSNDIPTGSIMGPSEQAGAPSLELIYRTMEYNHEQAQKESRKAKIANRQLQSSIKRVVGTEVVVEKNFDYVSFISGLGWWGGRVLKCLANPH
ncbi:hypothetical protein NDU88_003862 [Pleurodeles waltl]|uniref:Uncharacterized protein n=1 Tax=Pleurodeles waltl TaxID=8319 RepID=A0AAV7MRT5_PLEWA|nr:hypothetical protein NDU88_003862 [Pleurodeles waltl]